MSTKTKPASEITTGDRLYFPNSRHAQEVTFVSIDKQGDEDYVSVQAGEDTRWVLPIGFSVNVETDESEPVS